MLVLGGVPIPAAAQDWSAVLDRSDPSVGRVISHYAEGFGSGSGFILRDPSRGSDHYVLTNNHVVADSPRAVEVYFLIDGEPKSYDARIIDTNPYYDLALLRLKPSEGARHDAPGFAVATRDFDRGLPVAAIGFPGAADYRGITGDSDVFASSANIGRISRLPQMAWTSDGPPFEVVQHDAVINPGNSGGPLIDLCGNLVGVNTAGPPAQDNAQGIFWSTSGNSVKLYLDEIRHEFVANTADCASDGAGVAVIESAGAGAGIGGGGLPRQVWLIGGAVALLTLAGAAAMAAQRGRAPAQAGPAIVPGADPGPAPAAPAPKAGGPLATLAIDMGGGRGLKKPLSADALRRGVTIGRADTCDVQVPDDRVSRTHARLQLVDRRLLVTDLGSTGGTVIDGQPVARDTPAQVNSKSKIVIGRSTIHVRQGSG